MEEKNLGCSNLRKSISFSYSLPHHIKRVHIVLISDGGAGDDELSLNRMFGKSSIFIATNAISMSS